MVEPPRCNSDAHSANEQGCARGLHEPAPANRGIAPKNRGIANDTRTWQRPLLYTPHMYAGPPEGCGEPDNCGTNSAERHCERAEQLRLSGGRRKLLQLAKPVLHCNERQDTGNDDSGDNNECDSAKLWITALHIHGSVRSNV
jgi:hypothetical protein